MNKKNLEKLASYLESGKLKATFSMAIFCPTCSSHETEVTCGSVGCAVGHGPYAGIPKLKTEGWMDYSDRVFGLSIDEWLWCFSGDWVPVDNTPKGAAARIRWLITHGLPLNAERQIQWHVPLCYQ